MQAQTPTEAALDEYYLRGDIRGKYPVQMRLALRGNTASGHYFYESVGDFLGMEGRIEEDGNRILLTESDTNGKKTGEFEGEFDSRRSFFHGQWSSEYGGEAFPFKLGVVARFFNRQISRTGATARAVYPHFLSSQPYVQRMNESIKTMLDQQLEAFVDEAAIELHESYGSTPPQWAQSIDCEVFWYSDAVTSLAISLFEYSGGAHGNTFLYSANYAHDGADLSVIKLNDLFRPGSNYVDRLSRLCLESLRAQNASWVQGGYVDEFCEEDLVAFTLNGRGLTISFEPYAVGPYSEGIYQVEVPFDELSDVLLINSPAATLWNE